MSGFSSDWLALREPADHAARAHALLDRLPVHADDRPYRIVDLGTGTGSNLRYLLPRLGSRLGSPSGSQPGSRQRWRLIDNDPALLSGLSARLAPWAASAGLRMARDGDELRLDGATGTATIVTQTLDLADDPDSLRLQDADLVTCSALLDLFSEQRLSALAGALAAARCSVLFALSYDGRVRWYPPLPFDGRATALLNAHQRRDKGLGGAAGPDAGALMADALRRHGYRVVTQRADWCLDARHGALQRELIDGWMGAAIEQDPSARGDIVDWHRQRCRSIDAAANAATGAATGAAPDAAPDAATGTLRVGHLDLIATPG